MKKALLSLVTITGFIAGFASEIPFRDDLKERMILGISLVFVIPAWAYLVGKIAMLIRTSGIFLNRFLLIGFLFFGGISCSSLFLYFVKSFNSIHIFTAFPFLGGSLGFYISWKIFNRHNSLES